MDIREYIILGAGPGGLQMGRELDAAGRDYLILEAETGPGWFFKTFPRHRKLLSINKVYTGFDDEEINLRWDWNSLLSPDPDLRFKQFSQTYLPDADDLVSYLENFVARLQLKVRYGTRIVHITKSQDGFILTGTEGERFQCLRLVVATGVGALNIPPVPGIELVETYKDVSVNPEDFTNQSVLIIGKGNSAFETADALIDTTTYIHVISPAPVSLAWESRFVGHLRAANNHFIDTYQLKCQNAVLDGIITKIEKTGKKYSVWVSYTHASGEKQVLEYDRIILAAGFRFQAAVFDQPCCPRLTINDRFPEQTAQWESANIADLYFAGTLMQARDYKRSTSSFIHGFRYTVRALGRIFGCRYHGESWPHETLSLNPESLTEFVLNRLSRTSALWQLSGFLCDLMVLRTDNAMVFEEVPVDLLRHGYFGSSILRISMTLEFGQPKGNVFSIVRDPRPKMADKSTFLHPVIRVFNGKNCLETLHLLEDLHADWTKEVHRKPLRSFFERHVIPGMMSSK